jgi:predicted GNAT family acetyltransferase
MHDATYTSPAHRRKGYASHLVEGDFSELRTHGVLRS